MRTFLLASALATLVAIPAQAKAPITAAALTPDGKQVVLGSQSGIEVRTWPTLVSSSTVPTDLVHVHDLRFSPDGKTLLAAGGSPAELGAVEVLSWPGGKRVGSVAGHADVVYRVAWSTDGKQWATAGGDGICQTFAASSLERVARYDGHSGAVLSLGYLGDGKTIASVGVDKTLRLWNSDTGQHVRTLDNHLGAVNDVAVRPNATDPSPALVGTISEDRTVRFWQPTIGRLVRFARLSSPPRAMAWNAAGDRLFVGCDDGRVRVVDVDKAAIVETVEGIEGRVHELVVGPDAKRLFLGGETGCRAVELSR